MNVYVKKLFAIAKSPGLAAIWRWSEGFRGRLFFISLMSLVTTVMSLWLTLATKKLVDGATSADLTALQRYGLLCLAIILIDHLLFVIGRMIRIRTSAELAKRLQGMLVSEILKKEYAGIRSYHSGELVNRVLSDMNMIRNGLISIVPGLIFMTVSFVGATAILLSWDWHFLLLILAGALAAFIALMVFRGPVKALHMQMRAAEDGLHAAVQETMGNIRLIKASGSEQRFLNRVGSRQERLEKTEIRKETFRFAMDSSMELFFRLSWILCMGWGCYLIYQGRMTYGTLAAMIQLMARIQEPIVGAVGLAGEIYGMTASAERVLELTGLPEEEVSAQLTSFDAVRIEGVGFHYPDGTEEVLKNISMTIPRGEFLALTGPSGIGKTSLLQLLLGIYAPTSGRIIFENGEERVPASAGTRSLFAYVPQGNLLFSGTLRENLTMFAGDPSDEEIMEAARIACIDQLVREVGLDSALGERGSGLSEGQAQRVAIARALLGGAPILLLDEVTSALDDETEARLLNNLSALRDRTCIIVTHRTAALKICDTCLHLENGELVPD